MSDTTIDVLKRTREELRNRERRLLAFGDELATTQKALRGIDRTLKELGAGPAPQLPAPKPHITPRPQEGRGGNQTPGSSPRERFTERVVELLKREGQALNADHIAAGLDRDNDPYLQSILTTAALKGQLIEDDGEYRVPA